MVGLTCCSSSLTIRKTCSFFNKGMKICGYRVIESRPISMLITESGSIHGPSSRNLSPWQGGDKVDYGIELSCRPAVRLHRLAGWYNNPLQESTISPSQGLSIWLQVLSPTSILLNHRTLHGKDFQAQGENILPFHKWYSSFFVFWKGHGGLPGSRFRIRIWRSIIRPQRILNSD